MSRWIHEAIAFVRQVFVEFNKDDCWSMAAALAYYTVFALAPMLLLVIVLAGLIIPADQASAAVTDQFRSMFGDEGAEQIGTMLAHARSDNTGDALTRTLGIGVVVFGATGLMVQLQASLNRAWDVSSRTRARGSAASC